MRIITMSSRQFNQDVSQAKRTAQSIVELLAMPDAADIDFEAPRLNKALYRPEDF